MHPKTDRTCYLCMKRHGIYDTQINLEEHHVFGGVANRPLSERYGLKVYLCQGHHRCSSEAVHMNAQVAADLKKDAQLKFEETFPNVSFVEVFGKNYVYEDIEPSVSEGVGFMLLDESEAI